MFYKKLCWALAPAAWGLITWFLAYGSGSFLHLTHPIRLLIAIPLLAYYFRKTFDTSATTNTVFFFGYPLPLLRWRWPIMATLSALSIYLLCSPADTHPLLNSLVFGVCGSACIEELLARSYFVKYSMTPWEFIFFNTLTSCTFTLMHAGFEEVMPSLYELFFARGHFVFSFMLGLFAYKTKRIELSLIIHILSNFARYTLPVLILGQGQLVIAPIIECVELLLLAGTWARTTQQSQVKEMLSQIPSKFSCTR